MVGSLNTPSPQRFSQEVGDSSALWLEVHRGWSRQGESNSGGGGPWWTCQGGEGDGGRPLVQAGTWVDATQLGGTDWAWGLATQMGSSKGGGHRYQGNGVRGAGRPRSAGCRMKVGSPGME